MALIAEEGPEYVIDTDSYLAIKEAYPGLLPAINEAEGMKAVQALMDFTRYERPQEPEWWLLGGDMNQAPTYSGGSDSSSV